MEIALWINPDNYTSEQKKASYAIMRRTKSIRHLLTPLQRKMHTVIFGSEEREVGLYCTRKIGKTYTGLLCTIEFAWKNPKTISRIVFPDKSAGAKTIENIFNVDVIHKLPPEMRPKYFRSENMKLFRFNNGSIIFINGAHPDHVEKARGPSCDFFLFDEIGSWEGDVNYALKSIFYPQGTLTAAKKIYTTTPPEDIDCHFINEIYPRLKKKGLIFEATIYDNILLTPEKISVIEEEMGGKDSPDFQREYLLKIIPKRSRILVPEFNIDRHVWSQEPSRVGLLGDPIRYRTYITIDFGVQDQTFMLVGYYDHVIQKIVVIYEWIYEESMKTYLKAIIEEHNRVYENVLLKDYLYINPDESICKNHTTSIDCFEQTKKSLEVDHAFYANRVKKLRVEDSVGFLRSLFVYDKIIINPECTTLIHQLSTCISKDTTSNNLEIERDKKNKRKHGDGIMALIYMAREVDFHYFPMSENPLTKIKFKLEERNVYEPKKITVPQLDAKPISTTWSDSIFRRFR